MATPPSPAGPAAAPDTPPSESTQLVRYSPPSISSSLSSSLPTSDAKAAAEALISPAADAISAALQTLGAGMGKAIADGQAENARLVQRIKDLENQRDDANAGAAYAQGCAEESLSRLQTTADQINAALVALGLRPADMGVELDNILLDLKSLTSLATDLKKQMDANAAVPEEDNPGGPARMKRASRQSVLATFETRLLDGNEALRAARESEKAAMAQLALMKEMESRATNDDTQRTLAVETVQEEEAGAAALALQAELDVAKSALVREQATSQEMRAQIDSTATELESLRAEKAAFLGEVAQIRKHAAAGHRGTLNGMSTLAWAVYEPMAEHVGNLELRIEELEKEVKQLDGELDLARAKRDEAYDQLGQEHSDLTVAEQQLRDARTVAKQRDEIIVRYQTRYGKDDQPSLNGMRSVNSSLSFF